MALKGTLSDFGVADILQLIAQQAKTGILILSNDVDLVRVYFQNGAVVAAHDSVRSPEMYVGSLMVRAGLLSRKELDEVLAEQQRSLRRLGEIVVERGHATPADVREFSQLQLTETLFPLFRWDSGTYQFDSQDVEEPQDGVVPIKAESIEMSGERMMDDWPSIQERIPSYTWIAEAVKSLPKDEPKKEVDAFDFSALGEELGASGAGGGSFGEYERKIFALIQGGASVQSLIDRSRLGEFETLSALSALMSEGYVRVIKPPEVRTADVGQQLTMRQRAIRWFTLLGRAVLSALMVVVAVALLGRATASPTEVRLTESSWQDGQAQAQIRVLERAANVYRLRTGALPTSLKELVDAGLISDKDVRYPFQTEYQYVVEGDRVSIYAPLRCYAASIISSERVASSGGTG